MSLARILPIAVVLAVLAGCDGGSPAAPAPPPPPPSPPPAGNRAPVVQFTAASSVAAGQPLAFDGSASSDPDGDAISLHWDFGDGLRGGGGRLTHVFESAGSYTVTLTATDAAGAVGRLARTVTITAPPAPLRTQAVSGRVTTLDGTTLAGVSVRVSGPSGATAVSDDQGRLSLPLGVGVPQTLRFSRDGYVDQLQTLNFPDSSGGDAHFDVAMRAGDAAQTLPDAAAGGMLVGRDGAEIRLPPAALVTAAGAAVTGPVQIAMTPIDISQPHAGGFPGQFAGVDAAGDTRMIVSYGVTDFVLSQGGQRLQLAPGKPAQILLPLYAGRELDGSLVGIGQRIPLWSLNEASGLWIQEGEGEVVAAAAAPGGLALRATVAHFSPWNADRAGNPRNPGVSARCVYDDDIDVPGARDHFATATLCNWLAEMDRGIPPQGAAANRRAAAIPLPPLPGFSAAGPVAVGGEILPLPANAPIRFTVTALNGAFTGSGTLAADSTATEVVVRMRPLASSGGDAEIISLPFEAERRFEPGQPLSFRLNSQGLRYLRVTVTPTGAGSPVQGEIRVFHGQLPVAGSMSLQPPLTVLLSNDGEHRVELVPTGNTPATAGVRIELLGNDSAETLALPLDVFRSLPELTVFRASFDVEAARTLHFGLRSNGMHYRLRAPDGSIAFNLVLDGSGSSFQFLQRSLPASPGNYLLEAASLNGEAWPLNVYGELGYWQPLGAVLDGYHLLDMVADRDGRPVLLLSRRYSEGGTARQALALRRWTGSEWQDAAPELPGLVPRNCGFDAADAASLAFDSGNHPLLAYTEGLGSAGIRTVVQRHANSGWQALGPDGGVLGQNPGNAPCVSARVLIGVDAADRPLVALRSAQSQFQFELSRYDGSAWTGIAAPLATADRFDGEQFDLQLGPGGQPHVAASQRQTDEAARVLRYVATPAPGRWEAVGPDQGRLPAPAGQTTEYDPLLRFTAAGLPIVAGGNRSSIAVFRYDGSVWTAGAAAGIPGNGSLQPEVAFALRGSEAVLGWTRLEAIGSRFVATPLVQTSDAADRYTAYGDDGGAVAQFSPQGNGGGRVSGYTPDSGRQQRLLDIDGVLYQAIEAYSTDGGTALGRVSLLKLTP